MSPEKRSALLLSATQAVAEQGVQASTASIARGAGVAEGTLFTYFESKEALLQTLYLHLKGSMADTMMPGYPAEADYRQRAQHVFQRYVSWGLANPAGRLAIARLLGSGQVLEATRTMAMGPFQDVQRMMLDGVRDGALVDAPIPFLASVIEHLAEITIEHVNQHPDEAERHRQLGFEMLWRAIAG